MTLREVFTIPESTGTDDYVLRLSSSVTGDHIADTLQSYVVTQDLAEAFDKALTVVVEAQRTGENRAAFLEGSFGSGKSHFMAVLHALLGGHPQARAIEELQPTLAKHAALESANLLRLTFHFLDSTTIEQALFSQFLAQIAVLHPDQLPPVLHSAQGLFEDAAKLRVQLGDEQFFAGLDATAPAQGSTWSRLGVGSSRWTADRYDTATNPTADPALRNQVKQALIASHFTSFSRNTDWLPLEEGLEVIAAHAKSLGYQGVVLLLDELVLWLTFLITERKRLNSEVQKITKLVEGSRGRLAVPITSFVARQHDLRRWLGRNDEVGADQEAFERALAHQSGRFATIVLGDENLPAIAHQRLLKPRNDEAKLALDAAFKRIDRSPAIWDVLRDGVNASDDHRGADTRAFRLTYPFSPALIDTLKSLAGLLQRERTALKVMQKMLVEGADRLTVDNVIPVGEAFDDIVSGTSTSSDKQVENRFKLARDLWANDLRPYILSRYQLPPETTDADLSDGARSEVRIGKTLMLAALAPQVPSLMQITPQRLAALNHGSIKELLPNTAGPQALRTIKNWQAHVPQVRTSDDGPNPIITVTLADVDFQGVLDKARGEDTIGRRQDLLRDMLFDEVGVADSNPALGGVRSRTVTWRGTHREVDVVYGNVRDTSYLPDETFRARPGTIRLILDYPFDDNAHDASSDHDRIDRFRRDNWDQFTIAWLPTFFTEDENRQVGKLVVLNAVLQGTKWANYAGDLTEVERPQARAILEAQQQNIRGQLGSVLQQVYGVAAGRTFPEGAEPLRSLTNSFQPRRPVGASLREATDRLIDRAFSAQFPDHPDFTPPDRFITDRELNQVLRWLRTADAQTDGRLALERSEREIARRIVEPLQLAKVNETHLIFTATEFATWDNRISQGLAQQDVDPSGPVKVEVLREAVAPASGTRGLTDQMRDLIVAAWAGKRRRAWYLYEGAVDEPDTVTGLKPMHTLRPEPLPDGDAWTMAIERFRDFFPQATLAGDHLTASNLTAFVRTAVAAIKDVLGAQHRLADQLSVLYGRLDLDVDAPRLALADSIAGLFDQLIRVAADRVRFVELFGRTPLSGTPVEAARSILAAADVSSTIANYTWDYFGYVRDSASTENQRGIDAAEIYADLQSLARHHEQAQAFVPSLARLDRRRQTWLQESHRPPVVPPAPTNPPVPGGLQTTSGQTPPDQPWTNRGSTPGHRANSVTVLGDGDWVALETDLLTVLARHPGRFQVNVVAEPVAPEPVDPQSIDADVWEPR